MGLARALAVFPKDPGLIPWAQMAAHSSNIAGPLHTNDTQTIYADKAPYT